MATETRGTHTPWPWHVGEMCGTDIDIRATQGRYVTLIARVYTLARGSVSEAEANARLIAAAPEMLDALTMILRGFEDGVFVRDITRDAESSWAVRLLPFIRALQQAQAAVLKATGDAELPKVMAMLKAQLTEKPQP